MKSTISLTPVESSQLSAFGHDPATNTLAVMFPPSKDGSQRVYHYANVDAEKFAAFQAAESKGSFFIHNIKKDTEGHPFTRMNDVVPEPANEAPAEQQAA